MTDPLADARGLYVHVPFCKTRCAYCAFYITTRHEDRIEAYLDALAAERARYPALRAETVFLGGGTPSHLSAPQLERLCATIRSAIADRNVEWTIECNPATVDADKLSVLRAAGVNRVSIGAQAFDDTILRRLGRTHSTQDVIDTVTVCREAGIDNINIDLIASIPEVDDAAWRQTVRDAIALEPEHVSIYALSLDEGSALQRLAGRGRYALREDDDQLAALDVAAEELEAAGFPQYEISNFARPGRACQHNIDCWDGHAYIGLGPSASSHLGLMRWTNLADLDRYIDVCGAGQACPRSEDPLTPALKAVERVIFGIRMNRGVPHDAATACEAILSELANDGLVQSTTTHWQLTARGRDLADHVGERLLDALRNVDATNTE